MTDERRDRWLTLSDEELLKQCRVDVCRGTGPGGQKRNKTSSCVRLTHSPSGLFSENDESRSQHLNKEKALKNLRLKIALAIRSEPGAMAFPQPPGVHSNLFALWAAQVLDHLEAVDYKLSLATEAIGLGTGRLVKELAKSPSLWQKVNEERTNRGIPKLNLNS